MPISNMLIFIFLIFKCSLLAAPKNIDIWVVWNVGQGQWVSHITTESCTHIDFGGEFNSFKPIKNKLLSLCQNKKNQLVLTHWDYDHYLNIFSLARYVSDLCWLIKPIGYKTNKTIKKISDLNIKYCDHYKNDHEQFLAPTVGKNSNNNSIIYRHKNILISGDSPTKAEAIWTELLRLGDIRTFVLGHHGSRTSNSEALLKKLTNLKQAMASARKAKYGHPHQQVIDRLKAFKAPLLITEDWGNIWFQ